MLLHLVALAASAALMVATPHPAGDISSGVVIPLQTWDRSDTQENLPDCFFERSCSKNIQLVQYYGDYQHALPPCYWGDLRCYRRGEPIYGPTSKNYYQRPFKGYPAGVPQGWTPYKNPPSQWRPQYEGGGIHSGEWRYYKDGPANYPYGDMKPRTYYGIRPQDLRPEYERGFDPRYEFRY